MRVSMAHCLPIATVTCSACHAAPCLTISVVNISIQYGKYTSKAACSKEQTPGTVRANSWLRMVEQAHLPSVGVHKGHYPT